MDYNLLIAARSEYTKQLGDILCEGIYKNIKNIWALCREEKKEALKSFQKKLCDIPLWNQEIINSKFEDSIVESKITKEYLDKIIEAVFLSNIKILSVVKVDEKKRTINVNVPDTKNFIHKCYIETARKFYEDPYLIDDRGSGSNTANEIQRNVKRSHALIKDCIEKTIRSSIPMEEILNSYLKESNSEPEEEIIDPEPPFTPAPSPEPAPEPEPEMYDPGPEPEYIPDEPKTTQELFESEPVQDYQDQDKQRYQEEVKKINLKNDENLHEPSSFFSDSD